MTGTLETKLKILGVAKTHGAQRVRSKMVGAR